MLLRLCSPHTLSKQQLQSLLTSSELELLDSELRHKGGQVEQELEYELEEVELDVGQELEEVELDVGQELEEVEQEQELEEELDDPHLAQGKHSELSDEDEEDDEQHSMRGSMGSQRIDLSLAR